MLKFVLQIRVSLKIHLTGGITKTNWISLLPGYGWVWYHPTGIANVLSLARVICHHRVTYDSKLDNAFHVHMAEGRIRIFKQSNKGLYYSDLQKSPTGTVLVNTVEYNKSKYSHSDYLRVFQACKLQNTIGNPSSAHFKSVISNKQLNNVAVTVKDVEAVEDIFGPSIQCLKGKTTQRKVKKVNVGIVPLPIQILLRYQHVTLVGNIMRVNSI